MTAAPNVDRVYIAGSWQDASGETWNQVVNPATREIIANVHAAGLNDVNNAVRAAAAAGPAWGATPIEQRISLVRTLRDAFEAAGDELALLITRQMGTPLGFSRTAQIGLPLRSFDVMLSEAEKITDEKLGRSLVRRDPVGVVAAITPWNFPLHQIAAKIVPALLAGCTVVLKPSEITPLDALRFTELVDECGFPAGVFNLVTGAGETGGWLVEHPDVAMVSFTGSTAVGRLIAAAAGASLKKVSMELGGKSANVLLDDVDLAKAVPVALGQCFVNAGQTCAALTRLIVPRGKLAEVEELVGAHLPEWSYGDPETSGTRMGPLSSTRQRERVRVMVERALADGARPVGKNPQCPLGEEATAFFPALVLSDVSPDMEIACEEIFGPVLILLPYDDDDHAVAIANGCGYGLSGGVWSASESRAEAFAGRLRTGQVILNGAMLDMEAPFGGVGRSGIGRENGRYGLNEFFSLKAITRPAA